MLPSQYQFIVPFLLIPFLGFGQGRFVEISKNVNIEHSYVSGPGLMGGGMVVVDFDNDGLEDLYLLGGYHSDRLYKNLGNGFFKDVTQEAGLDFTSAIITMGAVAGDLNNNGFQDIFITTEKSKPDILLINNGDGTFTNASLSAGINKSAFGISAAMADVNMDGYLDIFSVNYVNKNGFIFDENNEIVGFNHECYPDFLYLNNGDGTFTEVAEAYGITERGCGLATVFSDINNDHIPDLIVVNDFGEWELPNAAYINNYPEPNFSRLDVEHGMDLPIYGMGVAVGDFNSNGYLDYYFTNLGRNVLLEHNQPGYFNDVTAAMGVENTQFHGLNSVGWGTAFLDVDNDGFEDLIVVNGYVPAAKFIEASKNNYDRIFKGSFEGAFNDVSDLLNINDPGYNRSLVYLDYDLDGRPDLLISNVNVTSSNPKTYLFYKNQILNNNPWLMVRLEGTINNRDGIGAKVLLHTQGKVFIKELAAGGSFASSSSKILHFGLGQNQIDSVQVIWPGGGSQIFHGIESKSIIKLVEGDETAYRLGCQDDNADNFDPQADINFGCIKISSDFDDEEIINSASIFSPNAVQIFPNPAREYVDIILNDQEFTFLTIYNVTGARLISQEIHAQSTRLNLSSLKSGMYILELSGMDSKTSRKIQVRK